MTKYYSNEENKLINLNDLEKNKEGLICLSGGINGPIGKCILSKNISIAKKILVNLSTIYKENFFIGCGFSTPSSM